MKAMILAAGRGERLRPLTDNTPKPLLKVGSKRLIEYHLERLAAAGYKEVVINIAYLGEQIRDFLGEGDAWELKIHYSQEPQPLETAGAIYHALPLLGEQPFLLINGDVWSDYPLEIAQNKQLKKALGHLILVKNPEHNPQGDYSIHQEKLIEKNNASYTFSGISIFDPNMIKAYPNLRHVFPLREVFQFYIKQQALTAEVYQGQWWDIGTENRLLSLNKLLQ